MKKLLKHIVLGILGSTCLTLNAQDQPYLSITQNSPASVQINWTNQASNSYHVLFTTNLTQPFSPLEDAFSPDELVTIDATTTNSPVGFFRVEAPTNGVAPTAQIFSPADAATVSGEISVRMGAQLGAPVQGVNLYLDDVLVGYLNSGGMAFTLDTTHFTNGLHTVRVGAVDTANNETLSTNLTLDFENPVRWLDACSLFNDSVPIDVTADFYPADWLVTVSDTNGTIVRTISGTTTDGNINTSWDGTDDNGQPLAVENLYQITVDVAESGGESQTASQFAISANSAKIIATTNSHGVMGYEIQKPAPNPLTAYQEREQFYNQLTPPEKLVYPPLPPAPANNPDATTTVKLSARDMFLARHKTSSGASTMTAGTATPNDSGMRRGSTKTLAWWENSWRSRQAIVARVPISGSLNTDVANACNQIIDLIEEAGDTLNGNRGPFYTTVQVISSSGDLSNLTNALTNPNVTALYFYCHGGADGNTFGTETAGVSAKNLETNLGNYFLSSLPPSYGRFAGKPALVTHKPFNFVFLDGCCTARGDLPEAFGIPKTVSGTDFTATGHKRAFMGWNAPVTFQFDTAHINWTLDFWTTWMDDGNGDETLVNAIQHANGKYPSVPNNGPSKWCGNGSLKYSD